jgi:hypothetical protein
MIARGWMAAIAASKSSTAIVKHKCARVFGRAVHIVVYAPLLSQGGRDEFATFLIELLLSTTLGFQLGNNGELRHDATFIYLLESCQTKMLLEKIYLSLLKGMALTNQARTALDIRATPLCKATD